MFNTNAKGRDGSGSAAPTAGKRGMFSVIGPDIVITGNIAATADLHIDGAVDGDVSCGALVQGSESRIAGNVRADTARIAGTIEGTVAARQLTVERAARISGDVEYESISIETGASIDGRLKHVGADAIRAVPATQKLTGDTVHLLPSSDAAA